MPAQEPDVYQMEDTWLDSLREMKRLGLLQQIETDRANGQRIALWRLPWSTVDPNTPYKGEPYDNKLTGAGKAWAKAMKKAIATFFEVVLINDKSMNGPERKSLGLCIPAPPAPAAPPAPTTATTTATATATSGDKVRLPLTPLSLPQPRRSFSTLHAATLAVIA